MSGREEGLDGYLERVADFERMNPPPPRWLASVVTGVVGLPLTLLAFAAGGGLTGTLVLVLFGVLVGWLVLRQSGAPRNATADLVLSGRRRQARIREVLEGGGVPETEDDGRPVEAGRIRLAIEEARDEIEADLELRARENARRILLLPVLGTGIAAILVHEAFGLLPAIAAAVLTGAVLALPTRRLTRRIKCDLPPEVARALTLLDAQSARLGGGRPDSVDDSDHAGSRTLPTHPPGAGSEATS